MNGTGMVTLQQSCRRLLLLSLLALPAACKHRRPEQSDELFASCGLMRPDMSGLRRVALNGVTGFLWIPANAAELPPSGSQTWTFDSASVDVSVGSRTHRVDSVPGAESVTVCVDTLAGAPARVVSYFEPDAYVPGQVVQAWIDLPGATEVRFVGLARDTLAKRQLLRILSTIELRER
jgi:hypothetical protein